MHRRNNPVAMFKPQPLENVILPNVHTWIRRRLKKFSCWIFPSLRAKREKKIKAMERDVIFFLSLLPRIFERPPVREIYEDRKKERKKGRERRVRKNHPTFFSLAERNSLRRFNYHHHHHLVAFFPSYYFFPFLPLHHLLFLHLFPWFLIRYLYSKRYICRARNRQGN